MVHTSKSLTIFSIYIFPIPPNLGMTHRQKEKKNNASLGFQAGKIFFIEGQIELEKSRIIKKNIFLSLQSSSL